MALPKTFYRCLHVTCHLAVAEKLYVLLVEQQLPGLSSQLFCSLGRTCEGLSEMVVVELQHLFLPFSESHSWP